MTQGNTNGTKTHDEGRCKEYDLASVCVVNQFLSFICVRIGFVQYPEYGAQNKLPAQLANTDRLTDRLEKYLVTCHFLGLLGYLLDDRSSGVELVCNLRH